MTTSTDRIGLLKPTDADDFSTEELAANWQLVDDYAGRFVVDSVLPTWGANQAGMTVFQKDTGLEWTWSGTDFVRTAAMGHLGSASRTTDLATAATTMVSVVSAAGVAVPRGGRKVMIQGQWFEVENTLGRTLMSFYRDATELFAWAVGGADTDVPEQGLGGTMTFFDQPGEGAFTYSMRFAADVGVGGTSTIRASVANAVEINVVEV